MSRTPRSTLFPYTTLFRSRLSASSPLSAWALFQRLSAVSPAPFSAFLNCGAFQVISSSPELFLRLNGSHIQTQPIRSEEHTSELQSQFHIVCRLLLEKKK